MERFIFKKKAAAKLKVEQVERSPDVDTEKSQVGKEMKKEVCSQGKAFWVAGSRGKCKATPVS